MTARQTDPEGDVAPLRGDAPRAPGAGGGGHDIVEEAGEASFPSSDPPSWSQAVAS